MKHDKDKDNNTHINTLRLTAAIKEAWAMRAGKIEGEPLTMLEEMVLGGVIEKTGIVRQLLELKEASHQEEITGQTNPDIDTRIRRVEQLGFRPGTGLFGIDLLPGSPFDLMVSHDIKWAQQSKSQSPLGNHRSLNNSRKPRRNAAMNV